jgi:hypothetical protein
MIDPTAAHNRKRQIVESFRLSPSHFEVIKQECAMRNLEFFDLSDSRFWQI